MSPHAVETAARSTVLQALERDFRAWVAGRGAERAGLLGLWQGALLHPARDFLERPGKQFRAELVRLCWALGGGVEDALPADLPLVVEILHAGSLIVDDVQDGSERRRGSPALHHVVGVPVAINTGNLFYCWALDLLSRLRLPPARELELHRRTAAAMLRCHQGQALDLSVRVCETPRHLVRELVVSATSLKAGALMELGASLGTVAAGADERRVRCLAAFGHALGIGLQMLDDLSGLLSPCRRHKGCEDLRVARPTWPWGWLAGDLDEPGFHRLQSRARAVTRGADPEPLVEAMADRLRESGPGRIRRHLRHALAALRRELGPTVHLAPLHLAALRAEIERLERSFV